MNAVIYHNPKCGTSRNTLALIRDNGFEPQVIEYLKTPPTRAELMALLHDMGLGVRDILREKEAVYSELGLAHSAWSDDQLLDAQAQYRPNTDGKNNFGQSEGGSSLWIHQAEVMDFEGRHPTR